MGHAILEADDKSILRRNRIYHLRHPLRVVGFDYKEDEIEFFLYFGDLTKVQRLDLGVDRSRRQIYRDALLADRFDMGRPLLDKSYVVSRQYEIGSDRSSLSPRPHECNLRVAVTAQVTCSSITRVDLPTARSQSIAATNFTSAPS